jgi:hypothetical protein
MLSPFLAILDQCEPFLIANAGIAGDLNLSPGGITIPPANIFNPQHRRHAEFLAMLQLVDSLTFGPFGMDMPGWVFYDCAVMPGAVFGLAIRASRLEEWAREAMKVPDSYDGLVPISQFIAIPVLSGFKGKSDTQPPGTWLLYTLESLNQVSPGIAPHGTLKLTFALGLQVFPIEELYGISQWRSPKLDTYVDLSPLQLLSAWTPAHSLPRTLSFRMPATTMRTETLLLSTRVHPDAPPPNRFLDADDAGQLKALQRDLEEGQEVWLVGRAIEHGTHVLLPLHVRS